MGCSVILVGDGPARRITREEAVVYHGPGFVWLHVDSFEEADIDALIGQGDIPDVAASALVAMETRPRCDRIGVGALVNLRGLGEAPPDSNDRLVSIRMWVRAGRVNSVARYPLAATRVVTEQMLGGQIADPGDLVAAFAREISTEMDPEVADLGDHLDDCETEIEERQIYRMRSMIAAVRAAAITYRRFVAPDRDALTMLAGLDLAWLAEDDRLHIREAADRFARMAEELEAVRERAALLHEQLTDLRAEQMDQRALYISIVAFIFLPLTFITGLLGMNVKGIPYAEEPWAFWGVVVFCIAIGVAVLAWFAAKQWLKR
ncbi:MAG: zinc transporter ZntB [Sphingomonadales bacterium]